MPAPIIAAAAIGGGASLLGGLFAQAAARKREARALAARAEEKGFETQRKAAEALTVGQQNAFTQLVNSFGQALLR